MEGVQTPRDGVRTEQEGKSPSRLGAWTRLLSRFLSLEILVQAISFLGGVLLVRLLEKAEYALFTIANTMQQTMNLLADNGISAGLTSIGGREWNNRSRFGQLLRTAMRLRRGLAIIAIVFTTPVLAWLLTGNGASPAYVSLICAVVLIGLYFQLTIGVLIVAPRLHLEPNRIQWLNLGAATLRLGLLGAAYLVFLNTAVALATAAVSFALQEFFLRRWLPRYADPAATVNPEFNRQIKGLIRQQAPNSVFYCLESQVMIWLISIFGTASSVAEVGALARLSAVFVVLGSLMMNIVLPRFARVQDRSLLWRRYWQILGAYSAFGTALLLLASIFPEWLLWILGPKYAHLERELLLMILGVVLASILETSYEMNVTRGWIISPWILIPVSVSTLIVLIVLLDVSRVTDVLLMGVLWTIPGFVLNFWRTWKGMKELKFQAA